jgi:hypothetical protein
MDILKIRPVIKVTRIKHMTPNHRQQDQPVANPVKFITLGDPYSIGRNQLPGVMRSILSPWKAVRPLQKVYPAS